MSFGISIVDIFTLVQLTVQAYENWKVACGKYSEITDELNSLVILTTRLEAEARKSDSIISGPDNDATHLAAILSNCQSTVTELRDLVLKYKGLGTSRRRNWDRLKFGCKNISSLRSRLSLHVSVLNAYLATVGVSALGRIEERVTGLSEIRTLIEGLSEDVRGRDQPELVTPVVSPEGEEAWRRIEGKVDAFSAMITLIDTIALEIRTGRREESVLTEHPNDDTDVWRQFRRELISEGFSSEDIKKHQSNLKAYLKSLEQNGLLEEQSTCSPELEKNLNQRLEDVPDAIPDQSIITLDLGSSEPFLVDAQHARNPAARQHKSNTFKDDGTPTEESSRQSNQNLTSNVPPNSDKQEELCTNIHTLPVKANPTPGTAPETSKMSPHESQLPGSHSVPIECEMKDNAMQSAVEDVPNSVQSSDSVYGKDRICFWLPNRELTPSFPYCKMSRQQHQFLPDFSKSLMAEIVRSKALLEYMILPSIKGTGDKAMSHLHSDLSSLQSLITSWYFDGNLTVKDTIALGELFLAFPPNLSEHLFAYSEIEDDTSNSSATELRTLGVMLKEIRELTYQATFFHKTDFPWLNFMAVTFASYACSRSQTETMLKTPEAITFPTNECENTKSTGHKRGNSCLLSSVLKLHPLRATPILPKGWYTLIDNENNLFYTDAYLQYWNQFDAPLTGHQKHELGLKACFRNPPVLERDPGRAVPVGWTRIETYFGRVFWKHITTKKISYDHPERHMNFVVGPDKEDGFSACQISATAWSGECNGGNHDMYDFNQPGSLLVLQQGTWHVSFSMV